MAKFRLHSSYFLMIYMLSVCFSTVAFAQDGGREAFLRLSEAERESLQSSLKAAGFYRSEIDGLWGSATGQALRMVAERLSEVGIYYDLDSEQSAAELNAFLLSESGYYFLVPEGAECDGCDYAAEEDRSYISTKAYGVFEPISSERRAEVRLEQVSYFTGRPGICVANLGGYSDGNDFLDVSAWRRYDGWGIDVTSNRNIAPPIIPPNPFQDDVLLMNGVFERRGDRWVSSFVNSNTNFMDQLGSQAAIRLSASQGNSSILIKIPDLPEVISKFKSCAQVEEEQHWRVFCLETIPLYMRGHTFTPQCAGYWK